MSNKQKPKPGRPTDYRSEHCARVIELGRAGKSRAQIAAVLDISRQTLDNWQAAHPEFLEAMTRAKDLSLAWWETAGQEGIFERSFNATAWGLQVRNRFPEDYRDKTELHHTGNGARSMTIITPTMTPQEAADAYAATLAERD